GDRLIATEDGRPAAASFANVAIDQVISDVERIRDGNDRGRRCGALDRRGHAPSLELAFASPAADLGHVVPIAAHGLAAFLSRLARLRGCKLMSGSLLVGGAASFGGDRPLSLVVHPGETPTITAGTRWTASRPVGSG